MTDPAMLLVEVLYQLRSSIDALASHQMRAPEPAISNDLALSLITGLIDVRHSIDKLADQQAEFQRDVMSVLSDMARDIGRLPNPVESLDGMAQDLSLIADRYRPSGEYDPLAPD